MNLPTPEHVETRQRELVDGAKALLAGHPGIAIVVTLGDQLPCGCCYSVAAGCTNTTIAALRSGDDRPATSALIGVAKALISSVASASGHNPPRPEDYLAAAESIIAAMAEATDELMLS